MGFAGSATPSRAHYHICQQAVVTAAVVFVAFCRVGKTQEELKDKNSLNSFYLNGSDGQQYYYTHLESVAVKGGQAVKQGDLVGAVGAYAGKNAHLHLAVDKGNVCDVLTKCKPSDSRSCK